MMDEDSEPQADRFPKFALVFFIPIWAWILLSGQTRENQVGAGTSNPSRELECRSSDPGLGCPISVLGARYRVKPEISNYRPDLYPTSYKYDCKNFNVEAAAVMNKVISLTIGFPEIPPGTTSELLQQYSGVGNWSKRDIYDPSFPVQFPLYDQSSPKNEYFVADGAVALVQRGTPFGALSFWVHPTDYHEQMKAYRREVESGK